MAGTYIWKTACIFRDTHDSVTIVFDQGSEAFHYKAGQFINLKVTIEGAAVTRSYSLCSTPGSDERPAITVRKVENGLLSNYLFDYAEEIAYWEVEGPFGNFHPDIQTMSSDWVVCIAGGSGITPVIAIIKYLLLEHKQKILLINSNKTENDVMFGKVLASMRREFPDRLHIIQVFSRQAATKTEGWNDVLFGRISRLSLKKKIKQYLGDNFMRSVYFICGPSGLINDSSGVLHAMDIPENQILTERFHGEPNDAASLYPAVNQDILFRINETTRLMEVTAGLTVLDAALAEKLPVKYSCKSGTCGICMGKLIAGRVIMKQNYALRQSQVDEGYILLCQTIPIDDKVIIRTQA